MLQSFMDINSYATASFIEDDEAERLGLEAAIKKSRENNAPGRPHSEVRLEILQQIAELDAEIVALASN